MRALPSLAITAAAVGCLLLLPRSGQAAELYASNVTNLLRGSAPGDFFPDHYGGALAGSFPVVLMAGGLGALGWLARRRRHAA